MWNVATPIPAKDTIGPRSYAKKWGSKEDAHCSEVLKTSIISASNNEGQTPKRIPERGRVKEKRRRCGSELGRGKRISTSDVDEEKEGQEEKEARTSKGDFQDSGYTRGMHFSFAS